MTKKEIVEYLERYSDDANLVILIANIKDRLRHGIKEYGFLFDEKIECPVLCIEVAPGENMDEFMISACKEYEAEEHDGESTEMVRTNADRIRSMTDEELAEWIEDFSCDEQKFDKEAVLEWLKSEVGCE